MREYELIMVISPEVDEENATGVVERVSKFITDRGGEITNQDNWGTQRLAYPIQDYREGNYVLAQFNSEPATAKELDDTLRAYQELLRHLVTRRED